MKRNVLIRRYIGAETLFDMTNTMFDGGRRKALLLPFQTSLLLLLPDVFEVASNMRDVKSSSISKKVSFLEMLRKSLKNRNETAVYCLTSVLRVARHFSLDSDAAILSYALDVQEEVREAVFRKQSAGVDSSNIDSSLMTAVFVSLTHLNFEYCVASLAPICLAPNAPLNFKISLVSACSHFARQSNAEEYQPLYTRIAEFVRTQLKVCKSSASWMYANNLETTFLKPRDSYPVEHYSHAASSSSDTVYHILIFLDASPLTLFLGAPRAPKEMVLFLEASFTWFTAYLVSDNDLTVRMTSNVARKLMVKGTESSFLGGALDLPILRYHFWKST